MNRTWIRYSGVLLLGILMGLAGGAWMARQHFFKSMRDMDRKDPGARILKRLDRELRLTPEQHAKVAAILEEGRGKMEALRAEIDPKFEALRKTVEPRFEALRKEGEQRIRQVLTPEQADKMEKMRERWEKWGRKHPGWGSGGFGSGMGMPPRGLPPMGTPVPAGK